MIFNIFSKNKKKKVKNFFDYPVGVQKKLVRNAVRGANEMQLALVKDYEEHMRNKGR